MSGRRGATVAGLRNRRDRPEVRRSDLLALLRINLELPLTIHPSLKIKDCPAFGAIVLGPNVLLCGFCPIFWYARPRGMSGTFVRCCLSRRLVVVCPTRFTRSMKFRYATHVDVGSKTFFSPSSSQGLIFWKRLSYSILSKCLAF